MGGRAGRVMQLSRHQTGRVCAQSTPRHLPSDWGTRRPSLLRPSRMCPCRRASLRAAGGRHRQPLPTQGARGGAAGQHVGHRVRRVSTALRHGIRTWGPATGAQSLIFRHKASGLPCVQNSLCPDAKPHATLSVVVHSAWLGHHEGHDGVLLDIGCWHAASTPTVPPKPQAPPPCIGSLWKDTDATCTPWHCLMEPATAHPST